MRSLADRRLAAFAALVVAVLLTPLPASAETTQSDLVLIRQDDVVGEDLYAAGNRIQISGRIEGDLVASSFGELRIDGTVEGDVTAIASRVIIAGVVEGSLRVISPEVLIEGTVSHDVVVASRVLTTTGTASVGRDVIAVAWRMAMDGDIGRRVQGLMRNAELGAEVADNVEIGVRSLTVTDTARIGGGLAFRSSQEAEIDDAAVVSGTLLVRAPLPPNVRVVGLGLLMRVLLMVFGAGLGLSMVWAATSRSAESAEALARRTFVALGQGLVVLALPFVVAGGVVALTSFMSPEAVLPLLAVSLPFVLALIGLLVLAALVSPVPPAILLGRRFRPSNSVYAQFLLGYVLLVALTAVPYIGRVVLVSVVVAGIGGWITRLVTAPSE